MGWFRSNPAVFQLLAACLLCENGVWDTSDLLKSLSPCPEHELSPSAAKLHKQRDFGGSLPCAGSTGSIPLSLCRSWRALECSTSASWLIYRSPGDTDGGSEQNCKTKDAQMLKAYALNL